jgi:hypothetical protein
VGDLPEAQADALAGALGLAPSTGSNRLLVSAAVLSLLAATADDGSLLCLVDDAQFLDVASAEALVFSARRLGAELARLRVDAFQRPITGVANAVGTSPPENGG